MVARRRSLAMEERRYENMELPHKYDYEMRMPSIDNSSDDNNSTCSSHHWGGNKRVFQSSSASAVSADSLPAWYGAYSNRIQPLHEEYSQNIQDQSVVSFGSNTLVFTAKRRKNPVYIAVVVFSVIGLLLYTRSHATLHSALAQVTSLSVERRSIHTQFKIVEHDLRKFQRTIVRLSQRHAPSEQDEAVRNTAVGEMTRIQNSIKGANLQLHSLQKHVQNRCRQDAITKYGNGVIRVELELEFLGAAEGPSSIVMEMASLDIMPHSVYMFLEMVNAKLYNGCSFILNTQDVIKAAPLPYDGSSAASKVKAFTRRGLESVAFKEYSPEFPHEQYTIGFAVDGSPSFYINTKDNSQVHEGDPCFAKIISGFDTVKRLESVPVRKDGMWFKRRVGIKRASIL